MPVKKHTTHTLEYYERAHDQEHAFPLPFDPEGDPEHVYIAENGLKAVLAFLVTDSDSNDPFDGDEGDFYQFDQSYIHDTSRPEIDEFKRIIRQHPGRVFTHDGTRDNHGPGTTACHITAGPFAVKDTKGENSPAEQALDRAQGYYIVPEDVTDPLEYAKGALKTYSQWCNGEVYGVCIWTYERASIDDEWSEPEREECWGYYGYDGYTREELDSQMIYAVTKGDPSAWKP